MLGRIVRKPAEPPLALTLAQNVVGPILFLTVDVWFLGFFYRIKIIIIFATCTEGQGVYGKKLSGN